jgi:hypothetical protein
MAAGLPLSVQERVMFFVGNASSEAEAPSNDATAARKLTTVPAAQASPPRPPLGDAGARRRRLSPSDVFVLSQETGPGFVVIDDFLGGEGREAALSISAAARSYDGLRPAGMGRGLGRWTAANKRGDEIAWLKRSSPEGSQTPETQRGGDSPPAVCEVSPSKSGAVLLEFLDQMESLRAELTDTWGLGADGTRAVATSDHKLRISKKMTHQLARYPGTGTGYVRHRDAYPAAPSERNAGGEAGGGRSLSRQLTAIYYLNSGWTPVAGGQLRLFLDHPASACGTAKSDQSRLLREKTHWDVEPLLDRLIIFRADRVDHEVLPVHQERFAITTWLYGQSSDDFDGGNGGDGSTSSGKTPRSLTADATTITRSSAEGVQMRAPNAQSVCQAAPLSHVSLVSGEDTCDLVAAAVEGRVPLPMPSSSSLGTIFVSIASFRDSECQHTLRDLFATAADPSRISVGVIGQYEYNAKDDTSREAANRVPYKYDDTDCFVAAPLPASWAKRVRCMNFDWRDAEGPCWARHLAQKLWRGEDFFLQIDSHMRFRPNWDAYLVAKLRELEGVSENDGCQADQTLQTDDGAAEKTSAVKKRKVVLTTYPPGYTINPTKVSNDIRPTLLCPTSFGGDNGDGMLRQTGRLLRRVAEKPLPSLLWAAGFNFSRAQESITECPYDPHLSFVFFGEEISMAARLWTHGFDLFAPPETVLYHLWSRDHRPVFQKIAETPERAARKMRAQLRIKHLLGMSFGGSTGEPDLAELNRYGLGNKRSIRAYEAALGVSFNLDSRSDDNGNSSELAKGQLVPCFVRADAKYGGQKTDLFNESATDELLAGLAAALGASGI